MTKIKLLSTRKLSKPDKEMLSMDRFDLVEEDFISINFIDFTLPSKTDLLLFTSQNAVLSVLKNPHVNSLKSTKALCVGEKTKELLQTNGFKVIDSAHYAEDLAKIIISNYRGSTFTFFCGNLRREILPNLFRDHNIFFHEIQVYENHQSSIKITNKPDALLFFSPSQVASYILNNAITDEICFSIGSTTSEALVPFTSNIVQSEKPTIYSVIHVVNTYYRES